MNADEHYIGRAAFLDFFRGLAFVFMVVYHLHQYNIDKNNFRDDDTFPPMVKLAGHVSRQMFIMISGMAVIVDYHNKISRGFDFNDFIWRKAETCFKIVAYGGYVTWLHVFFFDDP